MAKRLRVGDLKVVSEKVHEPSGQTEIELDADGTPIYLSLAIDYEGCIGSEVLVGEQKLSAGEIEINFECDRFLDSNWHDVSKDTDCPPISHIKPALKSWLRKKALESFDQGYSAQKFTGITLDDFCILKTSKRNDSVFYDLDVRGVKLFAEINLDHVNDAGTAEVFFTRDHNCGGFIDWYLHADGVRASWEDSEDVETGPYTKLKGPALKWVRAELNRLYADEIAERKHAAEQRKAARQRSKKTASSGGCLLPVLGAFLIVVVCFLW